MIFMGIVSHKHITIIGSNIDHVLMEILIDRLLA